MTKTDRWKIEAIRRDKQTEEDVDWYTGPAGPQMRGRVADWIKEGGVVWLVVHHKPSFQRRRAKVLQTGRRTYRAHLGGEWLTLEAGVKMMKEELEAEWRTKM